MQFEFDARCAINLSLFESSQMDALALALRQQLNGRRCIFVTSPTVWNRYQDSFFQPLADVPESVFTISGGEHAKTAYTALEIAQLCCRIDLDRLGVIVGIGGGSCTDLVGVAATLVRRGIAHIRVPTTLVGQIDAGIGLKCGVNFGHKKNYLGSFHAPESVLICPAFLQSLPKRRIREGLSEILKLALVRDYGLFELLERYGSSLVESAFAEPADIAKAIIERSASGMIEELRENPFEKNGFQRRVDYGHCFSPLIEAASNYMTSHGEAVGVDMAFTIHLAEALGILSRETRIRIFALYERIGLPFRHQSMTLSLCLDALQAAARHRGGSINLPLVAEIGDVFFIEDAHALGADLICRSLRALDTPDTLASSVDRFCEMAL